MGNREAGSIYTSREVGLHCGRWPVFSNCRYITSMFHLYFMKLCLWYLDSFAVAMLHFEHKPTSMVKSASVIYSHGETGSCKPSEWAQVHSAMAKSIRPSLFFSFMSPCALEVRSCVCRNFPKRTLSAIKTEGVLISLHFWLTLKYVDTHHHRNPEAAMWTPCR